MRTLLVCLAVIPLLAACGRGDGPAAPAPAAAPAPGETKTVLLAIEGMG